MIAAFNFFLIVVVYHPPPRTNSIGLSKLELLRRIDFVGGALSISGFTVFLTGLVWAGYT